MPVNISKPDKKRIIPNKIYLIILAIYILSGYILNYYSEIMPLYLTIVFGVIGFIVVLDGLDRYAEYEKHN